MAPKKKTEESDYEDVVSLPEDRPSFLSLVATGLKHAVVIHIIAIVALVFASACWYGYLTTLEEPFGTKQAQPSPTRLQIFGWCSDNRAEEFAMVTQDLLKDYAHLYGISIEYYEGYGLGLKVGYMQISMQGCIYGRTSHIFCNMLAQMLCSFTCIICGDCNIVKEKTLQKRPIPML